jgi:hypothetical protein
MIDRQPTQRHEYRSHAKAGHRFVIGTPPPRTEWPRWLTLIFVGISALAVAGFIGMVFGLALRMQEVLNHVP